MGHRGNSFLGFVYYLTNQIPAGMFLAALIFDIVYIYSFMPMWTEAATWLITFGLFLAIVPRLINFFCLVLPGPKRGGYRVAFAEKVGFWANAIGIVLAIINAFVHSRDAYAVVPLGVILSVASVALILLGNAYLEASKSASVVEYTPAPQGQS